MVAETLLLTNRADWPQIYLVFLDMPLRWKHHSSKTRGFLLQWGYLMTSSSGGESAEHIVNLSYVQPFPDKKVWKVRSKRRSTISPLDTVDHVFVESVESSEIIQMLWKKIEKALVISAGNSSTHFYRVIFPDWSNFITCLALILNRNLAAAVRGGVFRHNILTWLTKWRVSSFCPVMKWSRKIIAS